MENQSPSQPGEGTAMPLFQPLHMGAAAPEAKGGDLLALLFRPDGAGESVQKIHR